jgi:uncharacterized protein YbbK (DUF523 family)
MEKALVSACLLGINCRYDGRNCKRPDLKLLFKQYELIPVCPEVLGGLPTPRKKSGIRRSRTGRPASGQDVWNKKARVVSESGEDVTPQFLKGARECLKIARMFRVRKAFLKSRSPSCGVTSASCFGNLCRGSGICAALLKRHGMELIEID